MDPGLVVSTLTKIGYSAPDEDEAELFALLLLDHVEVEELAAR